MEGATLAGKLAAEVIASRALGNPDKPVKEIQQHIVDSAARFVPKDPVGIKGDGAIAFGGGYTVGNTEESLLRESDPAQYAMAA
jgi:15-cis-phytoene desaturase